MHPALLRRVFCRYEENSVGGSGSGGSPGGGEQNRVAEQEKAGGEKIGCGRAIGGGESRVERKNGRTVVRGAAVLSIFRRFPYERRDPGQNS